ncbi:AsmA family protein [Guyparkeria sp.]|uniref:AsmA family protein n=1 Tax=Guyparkeria sp. TaxID=2035736 RepID=UPI003970F376
MKWIKRLGLLLVAIILVAILAAIAFALTFDPNDYKGQIASQVEKQTGRSIQFNGDLSVTLFPWLGAATEDVELANAEGFDPESMVRVQRLEAQAALLPLLRGEFEIGTLLLEGAEIYLARDAEGRSNWDDLLEHRAEASGKSADSAPAADGEPAGEARPLTIGGIDIREATLHWRDEQAGQDVTIEGLSLRTGTLADGEPTRVEMASGFRLDLPDMPAMEGRVDLAADVQAWLDRQDAEISDLELNLSANTEGGPGDAGSLPRQLDAALRVAKADVRGGDSQARLEGVVLDLEANEAGPMTYLESRLEAVLEADWSRGRYEMPSLSFEADMKGLPEVRETLSVAGSAVVSADMEAGTATIGDLVLTSDPVNLRSNLSLAGLDTGELTASGPVTVDSFNPRDLAGKLGITLPEMRGKEALTRLAVNGELDVTPTRAMIEGLSLKLDGREIGGRAGIDNLDSGRLFARLEGGEFDLNPYLAPKVAGEESPSSGGNGGGSGQASTAAENAEIELPTETLRGLNLDARLQLARLIYEEYRIGNPVVHLTAAGGQLRLSELTAQAFDGRIAGTGDLDVRGDVPSYSGNVDIAGVSLQPLLMAVMDEDRLIGKGNVSANLSTQGKRVDQLKSALDGNAEFALRDGKIKGFDIGYMMRRAQARIDGKTEPEPEQLETDFTAITGTATIRNGVVRNDDLAGASPLLRVSGKGEVDLPRETIDYRATATVVNTATGQDGKALEKLKSVPVPIRIGGTFDDPKVSLDTEALIRGAAEGEVKRRVEEEIDKRLEDKGEPIKELLKGFGL